MPRAGFPTVFGKPIPPSPIPLAAFYCWVSRKDRTRPFLPVPLPDPDQLAADFWNTLSAPGTVNVNILSHHDVQVVESGGNRIVVIQIPRADRHDRPVYMGRDPFTGTYRRSGEGDYRCTPEEVRGMIRDQTDISLDTRVLSGADLDVFCRKAWNDTAGKWNPCGPAAVYRNWRRKRFFTGSEQWRGTAGEPCTPRQAAF